MQSVPSVQDSQLADERAELLRLIHLHQEPLGGAFVSEGREALSWSIYRLCRAHQKSRQIVHP
jgi:hypothetical protein